MVWPASCTPAESRLPAPRQLTPACALCVFLAPPLPPSFPAASRQQGLNHLAVHVGQAEVAALEAEGQLLVVDPKQVQQRRLEVVDVDGVLGDVVAEVVACVVGKAPLRPAAGHPDREAIGVVVAAVDLGVVQVALPEHGAPELAAPD